MTKKGSLLFKPGTILLFVLIAALGFGMYAWASENIGETKERSLDNQDSAIACSHLRISKEDMQVSENQVKLFFKSNNDLEEVNVNFEGRRNVSKTVGTLESGQLRRVTANVSDFSSVSLKTPECSRVFRFK